MNISYFLNEYFIYERNKSIIAKNADKRRNIANLDKGNSAYQHFQQCFMIIIFLSAPSASERRRLQHRLFYSVFVYLIKNLA